MRLLSILAASLALAQVSYSLTSSLASVEAFVSSSQDVAMYVYVPEITAEKPAIIVAIHSCERTAGYYFNNTGYASLADEHGFIVIYPNSSAEGGCWDVCINRVSKSLVTFSNIVLRYGLGLHCTLSALNHQHLFCYLNIKANKPHIDKFQSINNSQWWWG
jgi:hypothetical protein